MVLSVFAPHDAAWLEIPERAPSQPVLQKAYLGDGEVYWNYRDGGHPWVTLLVMCDIEEYGSPGKWWFMVFLILF